MARYTVVIERAPGNYGAYAPDVDGCIATGATYDETKRRFADALAAHFEVLAEVGLPVPTAVTGPADVPDLAPDSVVDTVDVDLPQAAPARA